MSDPGPGSPPASPWYAGGLKFACTRCGNCCSGSPGHVYVSVAEIAQIAAHVGMSTQDFDRLHVRRVGRRRSLNELPGGDCEFLVRTPDGTTGCSIHPVRPVQCRTWPFWKSNLRTPEAWKQTASNCPGIDLGLQHPLPVIQSALADNGDLPL